MMKLLAFHSNTNNSEAKGKTLDKIGTSASPHGSHCHYKTASSTMTMATPIVKQGRKSAPKHKCIKC
eukprot:2839676-Ditylum_brightwellii.AAC.1